MRPPSLLDDPEPIVNDPTIKLAAQTRFASFAAFLERNATAEELDRCSISLSGDVEKVARRIHQELLLKPKK